MGTNLAFLQGTGQTIREHVSW